MSYKSQSRCSKESNRPRSYITYIHSYTASLKLTISFLLAGEHPAAMQRGCASNLVFSNLFYICSVLLLVQYINVVCTVAQSGRTIFAAAGYDNQHVNDDDDDVRTVVDSISTAALATANSAAIAAVSSLDSTTAVEIDLTKHILNSR